MILAAAYLEKVCKVQNYDPKKLSNYQDLISVIQKALDMDKFGLLSGDLIVQILFFKFLKLVNFAEIKYVLLIRVVKHINYLKIRFLII